MRAGTPSRSVFADQLPKELGQDSAVVQVAHLGLVVDTRVGLESRRLAVVGRGLDLDLLARLDRVDPLDREAFATRQPKRRQVLATRELEGQDSHPDQARPGNPL